MKALEKQRLLDNFRDIMNNQNKFRKNIQNHIREHFPEYSKKSLDPKPQDSDSSDSDLEILKRYRDRHIRKKKDD